jgi:hypothetical protein
VAVITVRNQYVEVPDALAQTFAGLGAEQYLRIEEMWRRDQQQQWQARAGQQPQQAPQPAPQQRQAVPARVDQEAERRAEAREAIASMAKQRGQCSW